MACAATIQQPLAGAEWLPIDEAAERTSESVRHWRRRAEWESRKAGVARRTSLAVKALPRSGRGRLTWWVNRSFSALLAVSPPTSTRDQQARGSLLMRYPEHQVVLAYRRAGIVHRWRRECDTRRASDVTERELAEQVIAASQIENGEALAASFRTLQLWHRAYNTIGSDGRIRAVEGLIDGRAIPIRTGVEETGDQAGRSREASEYFRKLYHTESRHPIVVAHECTVEEARRNGWAWPASVSATRKWLAATDDRSVSFLLRHGKDAYCRKFLAHIDIDYTLIDPGQFYQTDHSQLDFWVEHEGEQVRPWLTAVQDARSRMLVGWSLVVRPSQDSILAAYLMSFRQAVPERIRCDNGADFTSELITGVTKATRDKLRRAHGRDWQRVLKRDTDLVQCTDHRFLGVVAELGVELVYARPFQPWAKGQTERTFGTVHGRYCKTFTTYCGASSLSKPECLEVIRSGFTKAQKRTLRKKHGREWKKVAALRFVDKSDIPTLDEARSAFAEFVVEYHNTPHSAEDMAGRTPLQVWRSAARLRRVDEDALLFLMQSRGVYKVGPQGVRFKVGGVSLKYGAGNVCLYKHIGREVWITSDPNDLSFCHVSTPDRENRRYIGRLTANARISPMATADELREANAAVGRRRKLIAKAVRESPARTRTAAQELASQRRQRVAELRATGTDDVGHRPSLVAVHTGLEHVAQCAKNAATKTVGNDRKVRDLTAVAKALAFGHEALKPSTPKRRRSTLALLAGNGTKHGTPVTDDGPGTLGTDAEKPKPDLLGLVAGDRHERKKRNE